MTYSKESSRTPQQLDTRLREAAQRHKFGVLHVHDLRSTLKSKGIDLGSECFIYDVCNPQAALRALQSDMRISSVLPCRISVFAGKSGGATIATVAPTEMMRATGLSGVEDLATEIEGEIKAIIDEAA